LDIAARPYSIVACGLLVPGEEGIMVDKTNRPGADEEFHVPEEERERGIADDDDEEFEDTEELDEEDQDDDEVKGLARERGFTGEIGSEGGSRGDLETERQKRVMRGSEATTTARIVEQRRFSDRHAGGGPEGRRR
jgi:hypothetical protein